MLIKRTPDTLEKLHALGGMASDDILSRPQPGERQHGHYARRERSTVPGVYKASMPNGKTISLMRVMLTDFCKYDCHYCPNSTWVPRKRLAFKPEELSGRVRRDATPPRGERTVPQFRNLWQRLQDD